MEYSCDNKGIVHLELLKSMFTHRIVKARFDPGCDIARTLPHLSTDDMYSNTHANLTLSNFYHHFLHDIVDLYNADNVMSMV